MDASGKRTTSLQDSANSNQNLSARRPDPPGLRTLRKWVYAGFTFDLVGAIASHILSGEPITQAAPAVFVLALLVVSYSLRRRQQTTG
jgi:hypothetical protein